MKLIVDNQKIDIPISISTYNTFFKRLKGLMFRVKPIDNEGILLTPCNSIHMFFMFFPIDVIFLNDQNQVVFLKENVKPWTVIFPIKDAVSAIELPIGTIKSYPFHIGDYIEF